ncbi:MAG: bifunctional isocitrate dehydrogenase kinase/phosphatase [Planctomycetota bacterium]
MPDDAIARECASYLAAAFQEYNAEYRTVTRRARGRFERRDWHGGDRDAAERIGLYDEHTKASTAHVRALLGARAQDHALWRRIKAVFAELVAQYPDVEFTKTYFSSVSRRVCGTAGADPEIQFTGEEAIPLRNIDGPLIGRNYHNTGDLQQLFRAMLDDFAWSTPYADPERCSGFLALRLTEHYRRHLAGDQVVCIDVLSSVFYRDTRAYVIGKVSGWTQSSPLVIAFANTEDGIAVDAVIQTDDGVSVMFGFARSYFHVDVEPVGAAIVFLRKVVPRETVHELFTILGRAKQGKTERYRGFARHLRFSRDRFVTAPGKKGMVMAVFTLPSYDVVFKVIRDSFPQPKDTSRQEIEQRYSMVARHDKVGRLVDAQEFRMLRLPRDRFDPELLDELLTSTAKTTHVDGDSVVVAHAYIERRLRPLDLYLREASYEQAVRAVVEYGHALRDLACTNIFPGDILLKNWGVAKNGRVVFYDYDELCLLTDCTFRDIPKARHHDDEMSAEPWFSVGPTDVFPEEWPAFLGFTRDLLEVFTVAHGELLTAAWWTDKKERLLAGEVFDLLPY